MTVGEATKVQRGYITGIGGAGTSDNDTFTLGTDFRVSDLSVSTDGTLLFVLRRDVSALSGYTLEFAGETLPLDDATSSGTLNFRWDTT